MSKDSIMQQINLLEDEIDKEYESKNFEIMDARDSFRYLSMKMKIQDLKRQLKEIEASNQRDKSIKK